ncbi:hypothetical protein LU276_08300 [Moraxella haemolytica]|uniref:hypothetical protein n=1 Tax=Moraxella TaxID=475 RepID=UPI0025437740|nr:hypothetical protein [Moraxella sp. ZY171148]WII95001.1 hypothetical protein LU276_08300 [Moraxella sp. ZY171148]
MKYKVIRQHYGDKQYFAGESREVTNEHDAKILISMGLIEPIAGEKAKAAPKNKAEPKVQNKAESDLDNKDEQNHP